MPKTVRALSLLVCLLAASPLSAGQAYADADLKELSTYTLTMDTIYKINRVMQNYATEIKPFADALDTFMATATVNGDIATLKALLFVK